LTAYGRQLGYHARVTSKTLLWTGIVGAALAVVCCATPLLVILLGALGLSALTGYLDYVLLPAIVIFIGIVIYALWRRQPA
jgi:mercuric ion transport protein